MFSVGCHQKREPGWRRNSIFFGGRGAAEDLVTVREAAEARDHAAVAVRIVEHVVEAGVFGGQRREQLDGALLHEGVLGVLERHVDEGALQRRQFLVGAAVGQLARGHQGQRVAGEGLRRVADKRCG
jgi:hypothetical protein